MNLPDPMLACVACSKHVTDDDSSEGSPHNMAARESLRSLSNQLKMLAVKFSAGAYRNCRPCTPNTFLAKGLPSLPEEGDGPHSLADSATTSTTFLDSRDSPDTSDDAIKAHSRVHAEEQVVSVSGSLSEIDIEDAARSGVGKLNRPHMRKTPKGDWVAQVGIGVFITFTPLADGRNDLKRIRFSREIFSKSQAEAWWADNCAKVCEEYQVPGFGRAASAGAEPKSYKVAGFTSPKFTPADANDISSPGRISSGALGSRPKTAMVDGVARSEHVLIHEEGTEWVEEDQPGVYLTIMAMPGGRRELKRVRFSREKFREKQAEAWWKDNRNRVLEQYLQ